MTKTLSDSGINCHGDHHHCYHIAIVTQMLFIHELDMLQSWIRNDMIFLKKHPIRRSEALRLGCFFKMGLLFWFITLGCPAEYYVRGRVLLSLKTEKEEDSLLPKNCQPSVTVQPHGQPKPSTSFDIFQPTSFILPKEHEKEEKPAGVCNCLYP